jgi:hypothetical protein
MLVGPSLLNAGARMGFKKFLRKAVKLGGKIAKPLIAATPAGQLALRAQQTFKALGGEAKAVRLGKIQPLSVRASIEKIQPGAQRQITLRPARVGMNGRAYQTAEDMRRSPGGLTRAQRTGTTGFKNRSRMTRKAKTATGTSKRVPPKGGLDLKAMARDWRAAGKPGTWIAWIKANPIKKAS